jgi:hypothetical protein
MESGATSTTTTQVTVDVPQERLAEFYARYARFLAGGRRGHRHGRGPGGCRHRDHADPVPATTTDEPAAGA